jgi:hypothetical protein
MAIGCDAIQAALADAGRDGGAKLEPLISAPCTAGISIFTKTGKPDARDDKIGWGELSMRDRHLRMNGKSDSSYAQFQQYAVQHYSANPVTWLEQLEKLHGLIRKANGGQPLPVVMSEFNIHTARDFAKKETTLDSPEEFPDVGSMAVAMAFSGLEELYFFRLTLSKNLDGDGVKKNGVHHVNESGALPEITGTTRAAEVIRLAATTLRESRDVLAVRAPNGLRVAATRQNGDLHILLARTNTTAKPEVEIALPNSPSGSLLTWETVTADRFGNTQILPSSAPVHVTLPSTSVGLLRVRPFNSVQPTTLQPSFSFSTDPTRLVTGGSKLEHALFQFPPPPSLPRCAFLHLRGKVSSERPVPLHLYQVIGKLPLESELRTGPFPFRKKELPPAGTSGLTVDGLGKNIAWVSGFTFDPSQTDSWVEITPAFSRHSKEPWALLLARDLRHAEDSPETDPVEWQSAELVLYPR